MLMRWLAPFELPDLLGAPAARALARLEALLGAAGARGIELGVESTAYVAA